MHCADRAPALAASGTLPLRLPSDTVQEGNIWVNRRRPASYRRSKVPSRCVAKDNDFELGIGVGGILASLIVLWSEYTLKNTGKGLPGDILGAIEGVSYLVVLGLTAWSITTKLGSGSGLPPGKFGLLGAAEGLSYMSVAVGLVVLYFQIQDVGVLDFAPFPLKINFRQKDGG